jgi:hypothetical protein
MGWIACGRRERRSIGRDLELRIGSDTCLEGLCETDRTMESWEVVRSDGSQNIRMQSCSLTVVHAIQATIPTPPS